MRYSSYPMTKLWKRWLKNSLIVLLLVTLSLGLSAAWWTPSSSAALPAGNAITDSKSLLRYALPIDNEAVRKLQASLEDIATQLRANRRWSAISGDLSKAALIVNNRTSSLLESVPEARTAQAQALINDLQNGITDLRQAVEAKNKEQIWSGRAKLLDLVSQLEDCMVLGFPFHVPA